MKRFKPLVLAGAVLAASLAPVEAHASPGTGSPASTMSSVVFRLRVSGQPPPAMTFWVAYGPLAGHFGMVRLHRSASGLYTTRRSLPRRGRTIFAYLAGYGVIHTRAGMVPGNPVTTIARVGPVPARPDTVPAAHWQVPLG